MPEFICCGPNNACINSDYIVSMEWREHYTYRKHKPTSFKDWWKSDPFDEVFDRWCVRAELIDGTIIYVSAPYTAWFENFIGPMPKPPKE